MKELPVYRIAVRVVRAIAWRINKLLLRGGIQIVRAQSLVNLQSGVASTSKGKIGCANTKNDATELMKAQIEQRFAHAAMTQAQQRVKILERQVQTHEQHRLQVENAQIEQRFANAGVMGAKKRIKFLENQFQYRKHGEERVENARIEQRFAHAGVVDAEKRIRSLEGQLQGHKLSQDDIENARIEQRFANAGVADAKARINTLETRLQGHTLNELEVENALIEQRFAHAGAADAKERIVFLETQLRGNKLNRDEVDNARIEHRFAQAAVVGARQKIETVEKDYQAYKASLHPVGKTPWSDRWRAFYYTNLDAIPDLLKRLKKDLDDESVAAIDVTINRFIYAIPNTQAPYDLYVKKTNYLTDYEQGIEDRDLNARFIAEKEKILEQYPKLTGTYLPLHSVLYHAGLACFSNDVIESVRGRDFIDGGACAGDSALFLRQYEPGRIFSFEPDTTNFERLNQLKSFAKIENLVPIKKGLSDKTGTENFYSQAREFNIGASMDHTTTTTTSDTIRIDTIDNFCRERGAEDVGFIKLDIEGRELEALWGAKETLVSNKPVLSLAIYHRPEDFFEIKPFLEDLDMDYRFMVRRFHVGVAYGLYLLAY